MICLGGEGLTKVLVIQCVLWWRFVQNGLCAQADGLGGSVSENQGALRGGGDPCVAFYREKDSAGWRKK